MLLEHPASLEERWLEVFRELGEPQALLACTFTFNADFFADILARFAEAACESSSSTGRSFKHLPVDVICDQAGYKGHRVGFNVTIWPNGARLFHPKLLIALFPDEVVWSDGSLNLTPAGWHRNREIAMLHRPGWNALPSQLREFLQALPTVRAGRLVLGATSNLRSEDLPGRYVTSLYKAIGTHFISTAPKYADEVHLVAPFFEKDESHEAPLDDRWLSALSNRYRQARFHVYLPQLEAEPLRVQGSRQMFEALEKQLDQRVVLHPVEGAPGPLHGKIACLVYTPQKTERAHMLVGSPNLTHAALMATTSHGNIETAWVLDERWQNAKRIFSGLRSKARSLDGAEFVEPTINRVGAWLPLRSATYNPLRRELKVEWKNAADASRTVLKYAGKQLSLEDNVCSDFDLIDGIGWLGTRKRGGGAKEGRFPIEVPVQLVCACKKDTLERTPEDWLRMLGALSAEDVKPKNRSKTKHVMGELDAGGKFQWSARVRDVAARMRYLQATLSDETINSVEREWLIELFLHIYDSHDPLAIEITQEKIWRAWVRLELWHAAENLSTTLTVKQGRLFWREHAKQLRRRLAVKGLSTTIRAQMRVAVKALQVPA